MRLNARYVNVETGEVLHSMKIDQVIKRDEELLDLQDKFEAEVAKGLPLVKKKLRP